MTYRKHEPVDSSVIANRKRPFLSSPMGFALWVLLAVAGVVLWLEHRLRLLAALPLLLPLAVCLGMHFFMHRNHGHGGQGSERHEESTVSKEHES